MSATFVILHEAPPKHIETKWLQSLRSATYATHYTSPDYFNECHLRDKHPFAILALKDNEVSAVLTGHHEGKHIVSGLSVRPQVTFCRTNDIDDSAVSLLRGLAEEGRSSELIDVFFWDYSRTPFRFGYRSREEEGVVLLDLCQGPDLLFRRFSDNKKTNIKKAVKKGVFVDRTRSLEDIAQFYDIVVDWSHRKTLPVPDKERYFENFLSEGRHLFVARHTGKIVAGIVVRGFPGGVLEYAANSSLEAFLDLRPNDLLHWRAIQWACAEGFTKYSLGGSHLFLRKFGGPVVPTFRYRLDQSRLRLHLLRDVINECVSFGIDHAPQSIVAFGKRMRNRLSRSVE